MLVNGYERLIMVNRMMLVVVGAKGWLDGELVDSRFLVCTLGGRWLVGSV